MGVIARQSIKGALANYLGVAIGFVTTFFVVTRMLTTDEVGLTRIMVDAAMLFSSLAQLGASSSVVRFFPHFKDGGRNHGVFGLSLLLPLVGFLLFALVFLLFRQPLTATYVHQAPLLTNYLYLLPMLTFCALYLTVFETNASVLMRITVPKLVREVGIRLFNLAAYLLYGFGVVGLDGFVYLFCGSYAVAMLLNFVYLLSINHFDLGIFRIERGFVDRKMAVEMVRYTLFMTATVLAGNAPLFGSLFLGAKAGLALTGVYTIAYYIANLVDIPYRSLGAISRPVVAEAMKANNTAETNRLTRQVSLNQLLVSSFILVIICINLDALFAFIPHGSEYAGGAMVVFLLGLSRIVNSTFSIAVDVLNYSRFYRWSPLFALLLTAATIVGNSTLIDGLGINGAALAMLIAYAVYYAVLLWFVRRRTGVSLFSAAQLKVVALLVAMLLAGELWEAGLAPLLCSRGGWAMLLVDAALRTLTIGGLGFLASYAWRISPSANSIVDQALQKIKKTPRSHN